MKSLSLVIFVVTLLYLVVSGFIALVHYHYRMQYNETIIPSPYEKYILLCWSDHTNTFLVFEIRISLDGTHTILSQYTFIFIIIVYLPFYILVCYQHIVSYCRRHQYLLKGMLPNYVKVCKTLTLIYNLYKIKRLRHRGAKPTVWFIKWPLNYRQTGKPM